MTKPISKNQPKPVMRRAELAQAVHDTLPGSVKPDPETGSARDPLPAAFSAKAISERQAEFERQSSGIVIEDAWEGTGSEGDADYEVAKPYIEGNPDKDFRYLSPLVIERRGLRDYQIVKDRQGREVKSKGRPLGWIPKDEKKRREKAKDRAAVESLERSDEAYRATMDRAASESGGVIRDASDRLR